MLRLLTGKTGSGKSYQAVSEVFNTLETSRKVFTNIRMSVEFDNYYYIDELAVRDFISFIDRTFKDVTNLDEKKEEMRRSIYFDADFYIDEAHLVGFRDKKESILNWLTLQRHFNQNLTIITQVPTNLHRDYLTMFHVHIEMIPQNKRLSKNSIGYREYDSYKGERLRTKYLKPKTQLFEIYNSGNVELGVNQDVFKLLGLVVFLIFLFYYLYAGVASLLKPKDFSSLSNSKTTNKIELIDTNLTKDNNISIIHTTLMCTTDAGCYYEAKQYTLNSFLLYLTKNKIDFKYIVRMSGKKGWKMYEFTIKDKV